MNLKKKLVLSSVLGLASIATYFGVSHDIKEPSLAYAKNTQLLKDDVVKGKTYWGKQADKTKEWENKTNSKLMYEIYPDKTKYMQKGTKNMYLKVAGYSAIGGFATHYFNNQTTFIVLQDDKNRSKYKVYYADRNGDSSSGKTGAKRGWLSSTYSIYINGYYNRNVCVSNYKSSKSVYNQSRLIDIYSKLNLAPQQCNRVYNGTGFISKIKLSTIFQKQQDYTYNMFIVTQVRANNNRSNDDYQKTTWSEVFMPKKTYATYKNGKIYGIATLSSKIENTEYNVISQKVLRLRYTTSDKNVPSLACPYEWNCHAEPRYFNYYKNPYDYKYDSYYDAKVYPKSDTASVKEKRKGYGYSSSYYGMVNNYNKNQVIYTQTSYLDYEGEQAQLTFTPKEEKKELTYWTEFVLDGSKNPFYMTTKSKRKFVDNLTLSSAKAPKRYLIPSLNKWAELTSKEVQIKKTFKKWKDVPKSREVVFKFVYKLEDSPIETDSDMYLSGKAKVSYWKESPDSPTINKLYSNLIYRFRNGGTPQYIIGAKRLYSITGNKKDNYKLMDGVGKRQFGINEVSKATINQTPDALEKTMLKAPDVSMTSADNPRFYFRYEFAYIDSPVRKRIEPYYQSYTCYDSKGKPDTCSYEVFNYRDKTLNEVYSEVGYNPNSAYTSIGYAYDEKTKTNVKLQLDTTSPSFGYDTDRYKEVYNLGNDKYKRNAIVAKQYDADTASVDIYREYMEFASRADKSLITQSGMKILDEPIDYRNSNEPFKTPDGTIHEKMYGSTNTINAYAKADKKNTMTYDVPDVDKNLRSSLVSPRKTSDGLKMYNLPLDFDATKVYNAGKFGITDAGGHVDVPVITADTYVFSKYTGFLAKIPSTVKPTETGTIKSQVGTQYTSATGQPYKDEPIIKSVGSGSTAKFDESHKMYHMPIEAESIVRQDKYDTEEIDEEGTEEEVADGEVTDEGEGETPSNDFDGKVVNSKPYPIDVTATKALYAKENRQIMLPHETYTNYGSVGTIGLNEMTFTFFQNYQFERYLAGSVQDDTWVAEQLEAPVVVNKSRFTNINDEVKGENGSSYKQINITHNQGEQINQASKSRSKKLFGLRSSDGISFYDKLKSIINISE